MPKSFPTVKKFHQQSFSYFNRLQTIPRHLVTKTFVLRLQCSSHKAFAIKLKQAPINIMKNMVAS